MALSSSWFCSTTTSLQNTHQLKLNFSFKPLSSTFLAFSPLPNPLATKSNAIPFSCPALINNTNNTIPDSQKWRTRDSLFSGLSFFDKPRNAQSLKEELFEAIIPLDRGAEASPEDQDRVEQIAQKLEAINKIKEPLKSELLNGKWELLYTTSKTLLQAQRPRFLRPNGKIYQAINVDTLRAQNLETWPFFNQATANLVPLNSRRVAVKFDSFKIASLIPIKSRGSGRGQLEITYLDEELRISRGNRGNLFVLKMVDPLYRVPL